MARLTADSDIRALLVIDQAPLFEEAMESCRRASRAIERLRLELERFESKDLPEFDRWYHSSFGAHLTEIRELSERLAMLDEDLAEARDAHWANFFGPLAGRPTEIEFETEPLDELEGFFIDEELGPGKEDLRDDSGAGEFFDDEEAAFYEEDVELSRRFEREFRRGQPGFFRRQSRGPADEDAGPRTRARPKSDSGPAKPELDPGVLERIKDRYRALVRKLHPDLNPGQVEERKSLWMRVQQAYRERNLEALDVLTALTEALAGEVSRSTGLGQLRRAGLEFERLIAPLQRRLEQARRNRAWGFSQQKERGPLARAIEKELLIDVGRLRARLRQLEAQIARFSRARMMENPVEWNTRS